MAGDGDAFGSFSPSSRIARTSEGSIRQIDAVSAQRFELLGWTGLGPKNHRGGKAVANWQSCQWCRAHVAVAVHHAPRPQPAFPVTGTPESYTAETNPASFPPLPFAARLPPRSSPANPPLPFFSSPPPRSQCRSGVKPNGHRDTHGGEISRAELVSPRPTHPSSPPRTAAARGRPRTDALEPAAQQEAVKPSPTKGRIRYRSPSAADLLPADDLAAGPSAADAAAATAAAARMRRYSAAGARQQTEAVADRVHRYRGVLMVLLAPVLLISFVLLLMPRAPASTSGGGFLAAGGRRWGPRAVDDAGSHKYAVIFDAGSSGSRVHVYCFNGNLDLVPIGKEIELFKQKKPGLSAYAKDPQEAAESLVSLLEEAEKVVPAELREQTPVRVGATAGLRALGSERSEDILQAVRDLLRDKSSFKSQPDWVTVLDGSQEGAFQWVTINYLLGKLGKPYANTVGVVDLGGGSVQMAYAISDKDAEKAPQVSDGKYTYGDDVFEASGSSSGASYSKCRDLAVKALKADEPACTHMKSVAIVKPSDFEEAARRVCKLNVKEAQATYPDVSPENIPYLCIDLVYQYTLLVDGFGVDPYQDITLVKKVPYSNSFVEAAWPLGSAIEVASSS
ncbi:hypothetical protein PR202_gb19747 [Eleusine coracana subsp. coracana]|uniref:Apyrase n=1 Tax=Eleusine coracana subsp. coracana TaxID=191504 RepID=A0AAV5F9M7_ELECO|nr:hypothetical protein PR202_gb19747 [Eleusine coracana subsp. coracana]